MPQLNPERYYSQIEESTALIAGVVAAGDLTTAIPTCPGWTLRQLASHLGRAHRWATETITTRSVRMIPIRSVPEGRLPDDPAEHVSWLTEGSRRLVAAIRDAADDDVWVIGRVGSASSWGRRMCHETVVHRMDAQLATGEQPDIAADVAADAIDEWLTVLSGPVFGGPDQRAAALPEGAVLHVHVTDGPPGAGEWLIRQQPDGVVVERGHGQGDAALTGPAAMLLQVLIRRASADDPAVTVFGDAALIDRWLAGTPF